MKTVTQISRQTGVSIRTLHHYDAIGLLKPTAVTAAGYRLYDEEALERLFLIIIYKELGFPLKKIGEILDAPDFDRNRILEQQIHLLEAKRAQLQDHIALARGLHLTGVKFMDSNGFNYKKIGEYDAQAKAMWGKTDAYKEYEQKSKGRTQEKTAALGDELMALMAKAGSLREHAPDSDIVQGWVKELQDFITANYYTCTKPILQSLGEMYAGGGSMTENIDKAGGHGTGAFAKAAIDIFCQE